MGNNDKQFNGDDLMRVVNNALSSQEFKQLNEQVKNVLVNTGSTVAKTAKEISASAQAAAQQSRDGEDPYAVLRNKMNGNNTSASRKKPSRFGKQTGRKLSAIAEMVLGFGAAISLLPIALVGGLVTVLELGSDPSGFVLVGILGLTSIAGIIVGVHGVKRMSLMSRFTRYANLIGDSASVSVPYLAQQTSASNEAVLRDLKKLSANGVFPVGIFSHDENVFFVDQSAYEIYRTERAGIEEVKKRKDSLPSNCKEIISEGESYIRFVHECNKVLPGEEITDKLNRIEAVITRIFNEVELRPELADELRRFMNYYLPTMKKLLETYCELEKQPVQSEKMLSTKKEIEATLDTIEVAFENLLDSFFADTAVDVSADVSVLHAMFAQDGLTGGFNDNKSKE